MIRPYVDSTAVDLLVKELKKVEPELAKQLTKELKNELQPIAARIQPYMPRTAPLSGMNNEGRLGFVPAKVKVAASPQARWGKPFVKFTLSGGTLANAAMIELAGKRTQGKTASGRAMIRGLNEAPMGGHGKTGRFFFEGYRRNKTGMLDQVQKIINNYTSTVNKRLNSGK